MTDSASVERLLGKTDVQRPQVVEYCVVCGDKASGKEACIVVLKKRAWKDNWDEEMIFFMCFN